MPVLRTFLSHRLKLALAAACLVPGGVLIAVGLTADEPLPQATFRVLGSPRVAETDALRLMGGTLEGLVVPDSARFVGSLGEAKAYVAKGSGGRTCFLLADRFGTGGGCIAQDSLRSGARYVGSGRGGAVDVMVPVPDGYTAAQVNGRTLRAANNVVLTTVPKRPGTLKVVGDSGALEGVLLLGADR